MLGSDDTPIFADSKFYDVHLLLIDAVSSDTIYKLRFPYGETSLADAIAAGQYSEIMLKFDSLGSAQADFPVEINMPRIPCGQKLWGQAWNATDNATIDFFIGLHEYEG